MKFLKLPLLLLFGVLLLFSDLAIAQTTTQIGMGSSSSSTRGPFQRADTNSTTVFSRWHQIYTASELAAAGITSGSSISELQWELASSNVMIGSGNATLQIHIKNSSATAAVSDTWANLITGSTMVVNNAYNTTNNFPGANGWMPFAFSSPFVYTGGALEISVDWDCSQVSTPAFSGNGAIKFRWESTAPDNLVVKKTSSSSPSSTLTDLKNERANIQIVHSPPPPPTVDITFLVNTANITVDPGGLFLAGGGIFGNPGDNPLTDANGDGVYEITITKNQGIAGNYIFTNGNCPGWGCKENLTGLPCADAANWNDRILPAIWNDTTIMTCYETCATDTVCPAPAATVDLTFAVDLSLYTGTFTTAYINGSFNGWNGTANPLTDQGNGLWSTTLTLPENDSLEYKFTLDGWTVQETFVGGESCTKTSGGFTNRFLTYGNTDMTVPTVCWESCAACVIVQPGTVDLTFSVDLSQYTGAAFTTAYINGTFNGWNGTANPLTDQGNGIWSTTLTLPENDSLEYKFTLDGWTVQENFAGGESCTKTSGGFTNRFMTYGNVNMTVPTVCWNSCTTCPTAPPATVDITFLVNSANITVDPTGLFLAGGGIFGNPGDNPMTDANGDGVWEITVTKNQGIAGNYIFLNGSTAGWGAKENLVGLPCSDPANYDDRILPTIWNDTIIMTCFETCSSDTTCPAPPTTVDLTLSVDLSQYTGSFTTAYINGTFNGWNGTANPLTDQGNGIWQGTINVPMNDSIEYKFTLDGWTVQETFAGGESCTKTGGGFTNRFLTYGNTATTVPTVCWESCAACVSPPGVSPYCNTQTYHFSNAADTASSVFLTITNISSTEMKVEVESATFDPVDLLIVNNGSGAAISAENISIPGKISRTLTWVTPPTTVDLNVLWSKNTFGGNWQLNQSDITVGFADTCSSTPSTTVDLTFSVDLSQYTGAAFTTAYINGDFNGWNGTANPLTDQGNGIWSTTLTLPNNDSLEYKFTLDGWAIQETFVGGESCTKTSGGFTNRFMTYGNMNMTVPTVCWESCAACPVAPPATVDITFLVNSANITVDPTGLFLAGGGIFGNPGDNPMTDANGDGVWEITITKNQGIAGNYIFLNGNSGWGAKENLVGLPCSDPANFDDRILPLIWSDTTIMTCFGSCSSDTTCPAPATTVDLTFTVDLSQYLGSFTTAYINGTFNGWNGTANPLTDQGNGLWSGTISVPENDSLEYKFTLDGWNVQENFNGGESCTKTSGGFTNRFMTYGNMNMTVPTVCWESCTACPVAPPATVDITFLVNSANITVDPTGLFLAGGGIFGNPGDNPMTDANGDGVWEITITKNQGIAGNYIFLNGSTLGWGAKENLVGLPCSDPANFDDRILPLIWSDTTIMTCFGSCSSDTTCPAPPATVDVTFSVDMSQYTGTFTDAYINGTFNGWSGNSNPLTDQGNDIWSTTLSLPENDSLEYKFTVDGWTDQEQFIGGESCTKTSGGFTNRFLTYGNTPTTVPTVCWNSCLGCNTVADSVDVTFMVDMGLDTIDPSGIFLGANFDNWSGSIQMMDMDNDSIFEVTVRLPENAAYEYKFIRGANWASSEQFDPVADSICTLTTGGFTNRIINVGTMDMSTIAYCYNSCDICVPVSTKPVRLTTAFTMMPNPANTYVRLNFDNEFVTIEKRIFLHNAVGQLVLNESINNIQSYDINTENLPQGMYFITIQTDEGVQTKRLIVNH